MKNLLNPNEVARTIGVPVLAWPGRCYEISCLMLASRIVSGSPRYGHWLGPVEPGTLFAGRPIVRHGWIATRCKQIVDPTRWVFENAAPYIYYAPDFDGYYDAGGNVLRDLNVNPYPKFDAKCGVYPIREGVRTALHYILPKPAKKLCGSQLCWIANLSLNRLGEWAPLIYRWLIELKAGALIPIDNRMLVLGNEKKKGDAHAA